MILVKHINRLFYRLSLWFGSIKENEFEGAWNIGKIISGSMADPEMAEGQERGYWMYHDQFIFILLSTKIFTTAFFAVIPGCWYSALKAESKEIISLYTKSYCSEKMRENTCLMHISIMYVCQKECVFVHVVVQCFP